MVTNSEPHEWVIFVQSTKIGPHENKAIHSIVYPQVLLWKFTYHTLFSDGSLQLLHISK